MHIKASGETNLNVVKITKYFLDNLNLRVR